MKFAALSILLLATLSGGVWAKPGHHRNNQGHHGNGMNSQQVTHPAVVTNHPNGYNQNVYQNGYQHGYQGNSGAAHTVPAHNNYPVQTYPLPQVNQGHHENSGNHPHH